MKLLTDGTKKRAYKKLITIGLYAAIGATGYIVGCVNNIEDSSKIIIASADNCIQTKDNIICVQD